ncbi:MAG: arsenite/tail-anchored protein-transporting ATPase [Clostridiales bacterium]|nr:arsenite/tail-anchored protein-transporting ATPase [Clostridiales bacterium]
MNRILIFTGKGGVGKTSIACAHAVKSAKEGVKTLLVSTDMAHNLGDVFEQTLGKEITPINEALDVYEIDPTHIRKEEFGDVTRCFESMLSMGIQKNEDSVDLEMLPGMEELFALLMIQKIYQERKYTRIIVDCAPTGETLALLKFPELLSWYMEKLFPLGKVAMRVLSPLSKQLFQVELPNKQAMNDIERLYCQLFELQELLKNREVTSVKLVAIPEKMVVEETKRNYMYMNLYNFNVDALYVNRILPQEVENPFFKEWKSIQKKHQKELEATFYEIPIYKVNWYEKEVKGMEAVERICRDALLEDDLFESKAVTKRECFEKVSEGYLLRVHLPNANKEELDLYQSTSDLVIKLHNFKRNIPLPNTLRSFVIQSAKFEGEWLKLLFVKGEQKNES